MCVYVCVYIIDVNNILFTSMVYICGVCMCVSEYLYIIINK